VRLSGATCFHHTYTAVERKDRSLSMLRHMFCGIRSRPLGPNDRVIPTFPTWRDAFVNAIVLNAGSNDHPRLHRAGRTIRRPLKSKMSSKWVMPPLFPGNDVTDLSVARSLESNESTTTRTNSVHTSIAQSSWLATA